MANQVLSETLIPAQALSRSPGRRPPEAPRRDDAGRPGVNRQALFEALSSRVEGEVRFDAQSRALYASDASNYRHLPLGVVLPASAADVGATLAACRELGAPLTGRGGGTALAGQTVNEGVILDCSKYMNRILRLEPEARRAEVEPGVVCDTLVHAARPFGLTWGPQPATHSHCCFGGMLGNNCGGMHAQYAGLAVANVESLRVLLYDGTELELGWISDEELRVQAHAPGRVGQLHAQLLAFRERYEHSIRSDMPQLPRRVSGYNLDQLLPNEEGRVNLARLLVGSEGTCAVTLSAGIRLVDRYDERVVVALGFRDVMSAADRVPELLSFSPLALEGMDRLLYEHVIDKHLPQEKYLNVLPDGDAWLLVELGSHDPVELRARAEQLLQRLGGSANAPVAMKLVTAERDQKHLWKVRESGLGATAFVPGKPDAWPGFEDSAVRPEQLGAYLRDLRALLERHGMQAALYGHFGMGCVHCRLPFELRSPPGVERYRAFMQDAAELVAVKYRGSLSGEHGDGQSRSELLERMFGPTLVRAFGEMKAIWDPDGMLNPGRVVRPRPLDRDLKLEQAEAVPSVRTHFRFPDDHGSFARATLRCVGVGKCRRHEGEPGSDTMCPSYMVTREERHSTRGRAHLLWELLHQPPAGENEHLQQEDVKEALDLCLACKGCKGDCPVNVDVATYKAEFLSHYYERRPRPRHAYAFGLIDVWARLFSRMPGLANLVTQTPLLARPAKWAAGITTRRELPPFARETFRAWFQRRGPSPVGGTPVLLWPDTFNNYFFPDTARAAVNVLEHAGFSVTLPAQPLCCGRPLYDYGLLDRAKQRLERILSLLSPQIERGTPIVMLEPSCCSVFRDELVSLFPDRADARALSRQVVLLSELLARHPERIPTLARRAVVQGHCHHKSVLRFNAEQDVLRAMQLDAEVLTSGCCGLAGSFGFEPDKYEVAQACGERSLLPAVRAQSSDTLILANGFSCRNQIAHGTDRVALHLAEALDLALEHGSAGPAPSDRPEAAIRDARRRELWASMRQAAGKLLLGAGLALGVLALRGRRRP